MLYQINKQKRGKLNKKGVSVLIGYVLLISFVIVISVVVYQLLKTYVPTEIGECPSGTSIILKEYECDDRLLNLTIQNKGLFNVGGVFVHVSTNENIEIPITNLVERFVTNGNFDGIEGGIPAGESLLFNLNSENSLVVGEDKMIIFDTDYIVGGLNPDQIHYIGITPIRFQEEDGKTKFVSCGNSNIIQKLDCSVI